MHLVEHPAFDLTDVNAHPPKPLQGRHLEPIHDLGNLRVVGIVLDA